MALSLDVVWAVPSVMKCVKRAKLSFYKVLIHRGDNLKDLLRWAGWSFGYWSGHSAKKRKMRKMFNRPDVVGGEEGMFCAVGIIGTYAYITLNSRQPKSRKRTIDRC